MAKENQVANSAFFFSLLFYFIRSTNEQYFSNNFLLFSTYLLIVLCSIFAFIYINHLKIFYSPIVGGMVFACTNLGIVMAGTQGLDNSTPEIIDGLSRIVLALLTIWKLRTDMRHLKLEIDPFTVKRSSVSRLF
ncbi:MAG: hypothetical protein OEY49_09120, partial [Candidatus Heimdallarchaeota archaeon]|nr:hypothetical protein [Candidatus Heimdallarchaeota archaeon]